MAEQIQILFGVVVSSLFGVVVSSLFGVVSSSSSNFVWRVVCLPLSSNPNLTWLTNHSESEHYICECRVSIYSQGFTLLFRARQTYTLINTAPLCGPY